MVKYKIFLFSNNKIWRDIIDKHRDYLINVRDKYVYGDAGEGFDTFCDRNDNDGFIHRAFTDVENREWKMDLNQRAQSMYDPEWLVWPHHCQALATVLFPLVSNLTGRKLHIIHTSIHSYISTCPLDMLTENGGVTNDRTHPHLVFDLNSQFDCLDDWHSRNTIGQWVSEESTVTFTDFDSSMQWLEENTLI